MPLGQGRALARLGLTVVDGGRDSVEADEATTENGVESEDRQSTVVPDADLEPPVSKVGLVKTILEGFLEDRGGCLPLRFCFPFGVRQAAIRTRSFGSLQDSGLDISTG